MDSDFDIAIVGGGLSGALAAAILGRQGYRLALVDLYERHPPALRVEKIAGDQVELMERLGLLDALTQVAAPFNSVLNMRAGRIVDQTHARHFGIMYDELVRFARAQVPSHVRTIVGRAVDIKTSAERQTVTLLGGQELGARLVVLATGMGDALRGKLGISRRVIAEKQSFTFGFDLTLTGGRRPDFEALTYYGNGLVDGIDYLSLFPTPSAADGALRANLFTFRDHRDPWIRALRAEPKRTLMETLPGLRQALGDFEIVSPVQNWLMDLAIAENVRQPGIVLIGDAFQTSCPAAGTGVSRLLTDIERLCVHHVPAWFVGPGMDAVKVSEFYNDPVKMAMDARALKMAAFRRSFTVDRGWLWRLRRQATFWRRRLLALRVGAYASTADALPGPAE